MDGLDNFEAVVAGARWAGARVEVCMLVEGEDGAGVPVAEDVAAFAAVVTADKVVERAFAGWIVADGGFGIRL